MVSIHNPHRRGSVQVKTSGKNLKTYNNFKDDDSDDDQQKSGAFTETSSFYQLHKILSSD